MSRKDADSGQCNTISTVTALSARRTLKKNRAARLVTAWTADQFWDRLAPVIFAFFVAGLITVLVLAYAGVPLV